MKYLITYKLFESSSEDMIDEVEDMLLNLYDKEYTIKKYIELENSFFYNWSTPSYKTSNFTDVDSDEESSPVFDKLKIWKIYITNGWTSGDTRPHPRQKPRGPKSQIDINDVKDIILQINDYVKSQGHELEIYFGVQYETQSGSHISWDPERVKGHIRGNDITTGFHYGFNPYDLDRWDPPSILIQIK